MSYYKNLSTIGKISAIVTKDCNITLTPEAIEMGRIKIFQILNRMGYTPRSASIFKAEFEECRKLCIAQRGFIKSIHTWWGISELKLLKEVGLRFSACHASSANTERIFSALNKASTPSRNRSGVTNLFNLMMIRTIYLAELVQEKRESLPSIRKMSYQKKSRDISN